jgi:glycosyltransferase involved in cell wall biosynthesis
VVAPLRIARGIQNKVLEAMAMDKAIVATSMAMEGINAPAMPYLRQADDAIPFAEACLELLNREQLATVDGQHRTWIIQHFTWQATLAQFAQLVKG